MSTSSDVSCTLGMVDMIDMKVEGKACCLGVPLF